MHRLLNFARSMEYITKLTQSWYYNYKITMFLGFRTCCKIGSTNTIKMYEITIEPNFKSNSRLKTRCVVCVFLFWGLYAMFFDRTLITSTLYVMDTLNATIQAPKLSIQG